MNIRHAKKEDIAQLLTLCAEHAEHEKAAFDPTDKDKLLSKRLFGADPVVKCMVVVGGDQLMGYATFMKQFSTWDAAYYVYLDCLYLRKEIRGRGLGYKMMGLVKQYASEEGCEIIQWQTPGFNTDAIAFYHRLGAKSKLKQRFFWQMI